MYSTNAGVVLDVQPTVSALDDEDVDAANNEVFSDDDGFEMVIAAANGSSST